MALNRVEGAAAKRGPCDNAAPPRQYPGASVQQASPEIFPEQRLLGGLLGDEFRAYFQPKIELKSMRVIGLEVLARWEPRFGTVIAPAMFLPSLERMGALDLLLFRLVEQATGLLRHMGRPDMGLAFNVSPTQLGCPSFARRFLAVLRACRYDTKQITVEITEDCPIVDLEACGRILADLKLAGCRLAMDDYGKGYSSLNRLVTLPFDEIKLDGSFAKMGVYSLPIVQNSLALARSLNVSLVVEGIERAEHHEQLLALGCSLAQGYFYGMPMSAERLSMHLSRRES
ncbi:EAL domain-containing protein [Achromobacter xylosoxidans]